MSTYFNNLRTPFLCLICLAIGISFSLAEDQKNGTQDDFDRLIKKIGASYKSGMDSTYEYVVQLDSITKQDTAYKRRGNVMYQYALFYYYTRNVDSSLHYFEKAQKYAVLDNDSATEARMMASAAYTQWAMGNRDSAFIKMYKAHDRLAKLGDTASLGICKMNIGIGLDSEGEPAKALEYHLVAIDLLGNAKDDKNLGRAYVNTGLVYAKLEKLDKAIGYYKKSIQVFEKLGDSISIGIAGSNLSSVYTNMGEEEKAYNLLKRVEAIYEPTNHLYGKMSTYTALLQYHSKKRNPDLEKAIYYADLSIELGKKIMSMEMVVENLLQLGVIYNNQKKDIDKSIESYQEALKVAVTIDGADYARKAHHTLAFLFKEVGQKDSSIHHFEEYLVLNDSLINREKIEQFKENELQYQFDREKLADSLRTINEKQVLELAHANELASEKQGKLMLTVAIVFAIVLILFLTILFIRKRTQERQLNQKNQEIEKALYEKGLLLKEIHHRVKNNFQVVSSLLELQTKGIEDDKARALAEEGKNRVKSMALIHQRLYQNDDLLIAFDEYIKALVDEISDMYSHEHDVAVDIDAKGMNFDIDTAIPLGLIVNELVTNAFKYGFDETHKNLHISVEKLSDEYKLVVKDNGQGLPPHLDISKAKSLGLRLVRRLSQQLKGRLIQLDGPGAAFAVYFKDTNTRASMN